MPQAGEIRQDIEVTALVHPNSDDLCHATRAEHLPGLEWIMRPPLPKEGLEITRLSHADERAEGDPLDLGPQVPRATRPPLACAAHRISYRVVFPSA